MHAPQCTIYKISPFLWCQNLRRSSKIVKKFEGNCKFVPSLRVFSRNESSESSPNPRTGTHATRRGRRAVEARIRLSRHGSVIDRFQDAGRRQVKTVRGVETPRQKLHGRRWIYAAAQQIRPDKVNSRQTNGAARRGTRGRRARCVEARWLFMRVYQRSAASSNWLVEERRRESNRSVGLHPPTHQSVRPNVQHRTDPVYPRTNAGGPSGSQDNFHR